MSDSITVLAGLQYNQGDIIRQTIAASFIADYGIVKAVNSDKTIDVTHAVQGAYIDGTNMPVTVTRSVEVIFPGSSGMALTWPIAVGDGVLLIGLKQFVKATKSLNVPSGQIGQNSPLKEFPHYNQDTLKAIPLQNVSSPKVSLTVDSSNNVLLSNTTAGLFQIKNSMQSLATLMSTLISDIISIQTVGSSTSQVLNPATVTAFNNLQAQFNQLLES